MKKLLLLLGMLISVYGFAQQPQIRYRVNVERDSNGNIIRYDSTYVMTWSSNGQNPVDIDSLMQAMGIELVPFEGEFYGNDTTQNGYMPGFGMQPFGYMPDEYFNRMNEMMQQMEEMHRRMLEEMEQMQKMYGTEPPQPPIEVPDTSTSDKVPVEELKTKSVNL